MFEEFVDGIDDAEQIVGLHAEKTVLVEPSVLFLQTSEKFLADEDDSLGWRISSVLVLGDQRGGFLESGGASRENEEGIRDLSTDLELPRIVTVRARCSGAA